jgi:NADP-dependent 3-hydroxy acid dehydrogenase YdfG
VNKPLRVFITGASSGLGAALAQHYGTTGARLGLLGRRGEALQHTAQGLDAHCYQADVRDAAAVQAAAQTFMNEVGPPDIVIAAAGISVGALTEEAGDRSVFRAVMDANVLGLVHTFQPFIAPMQARGGGVLCGISSVAGVRGLPGGGAYSAAKVARCIERRRAYTVIPWQMAGVARLLKWLPIPLYDLLFEKAPRKPRGLPT